MQREPVSTSKQASIPPLVLDRQEAASALRISTRKLDYLIHRGEIAATRIDGRVLVSWTELLRFVASKSAGETLESTAEMCGVAVEVT
jgi:excisionase family DNA binding protein